MLSNSKPLLRLAHVRKASHRLGNRHPGWESVLAFRRALASPATDPLKGTMLCAARSIN
jgi:hypothetical protein